MLQQPVCVWFLDLSLSSTLLPHLTRRSSMPTAAASGVMSIASAYACRRPIAPSSSAASMRGADC